MIAMILLYGSLTDPPLVRTLEAVQSAGASYVLLAQSALDRERFEVEVGPCGLQGTIVSAGQRVPLRDVHSVYARPLELPTAAFDPSAVPHARAVHERVCEWLDVADALVVNRPAAMETNASKPLQAQLIAEAGLPVPETLVTSDEQEAREFWRTHGRVIFKSISGIRSIVRELTDADSERLHLLADLPVQFQEFVAGVDVRVHVVDDEVYAAEIRSGAVDYRYAARDGAAVEMQAIDLPADVAERCVALTRRLGLFLAGIDLRRRPDGGYVCFEANPMPAYTYFEANTGLPIAEALASLLVRGTRRRKVQEVQMVQAVENLAAIRGTIVSRRPHGTLPDYDVVTVKLERAENVGDKTNLLVPMIGKEVEVATRRTLLRDAKAGMELRCRAKRTADGAMCEKEPEPGDFEIIAR